MRDFANARHGPGEELGVAVFRNHLKLEDLSYPNSEDIQSEDIQSEEVVTPLHNRSFRKRPSFLQVANAMFILVASLAIIGPPILDKVFNIHIGVSQYNHLGAGLHHGDLLVIKEIAMSQLTWGDVVIVHGIVGETPDQQYLGSVIAAPNSKKVNVSILEDSGRVRATESVTENSKILVVTRYFPKVGNFLNLLFCNVVKVGFVFFVGVSNLLVYISKRRDANSRGSSKDQLFNYSSESVPYEMSAESV